MSVLAVLLRSRDRGDVRAEEMELAEDLAAILTEDERHAAGREGWPPPQFLARASGWPLAAIEGLCARFDEAAEITADYSGLSWWGRLRFLIRTDPAISRFAKASRGWFVRIRRG